MVMNVRLVYKIINGPPGFLGISGEGLYISKGAGYFSGMLEASTKLWGFREPSKKKKKKKKQLKNLTLKEKSPFCLI